MQYVVLLRGVNAGPRNRIQMNELRSALQHADFENVRTHAQSGNVVLTHKGSAQAVETGVRQLIASRFGLAVDLIVRDEHSMRRILAENPLSEIATDPQRQFVVFCSEPHDPSRLPRVAAPEVLVSRPMEIHAWCPNGVRQGKLMAALGRQPPARITTFRNWNTVTNLASTLDA